MRQSTGLLAALMVATVCAGAFALYSIAEEGLWPKSWPAELEPLRKQARTAVGPTFDQQHIDIPFKTREEFEAAWPHLLKVKSMGVPIILVKGPDTWLNNTIAAGVRMHVPPAGSKESDSPVPEQKDPRVTWMHTTFIELVVDGKVVDLNRIRLPEDAAVVDERFKEEKGAGQGK